MKKQKKLSAPLKRLAQGYVANDASMVLVKPKIMFKPLSEALTKEEIADRLRIVRAMEANDAKAD